MQRRKSIPPEPLARRKPESPQVRPVFSPGSAHHDPDMAQPLHTRSAQVPHVEIGVDSSSPVNGNQPILVTVPHSRSRLEDDPPTGFDSGACELDILAECAALQWQLFPYRSPDGRRYIVKIALIPQGVWIELRPSFEGFHLYFDPLRTKAQVSLAATSDQRAALGSR